MMRGVWHCSQLLHRLAHLAFGLCVVAAVAVSVGAWRLSQGPVDVSWLSERARAALLDEASPVQVRFDHASLAWGGWTKRLDHLIELQVSQVVVQSGRGQALAEAPRAWMTFSLPALLAGRFVPRSVEIDDAWIVLPSGAADGQAAGETDRRAMVRRVAEAVNGRSAAHPGMLDRLVRVHLRNASVAVPAMGGLPPMQGSAIDVNIMRQRDGHVRGTVTGTVATSQQSSDLVATLDLVRNAESRVSVRMSPFRPAALGDISVLGAVDAPVSVSAHATVDRDFEPLAGQVFLGLGAGTVRLGRGEVPLRGGSVELSGTPKRVSLTHGTFEVSPDPAGSPAVLRVSGTAARDGERVRASADLGLENVNLAELGQLWPEGVGGGPRSWVVTHVLGGMATHGTAQVALEADRNFGHVALTRASGAVDGSGVTFTWLDKVPAIERAEVHLRWLDPDSLDVLVPSGRQRTGTDDPDLLVDHGVVHITGLSQRDQTAAIEVNTQGLVTSALALLKQPRLHLLSDHPLGFKAEAGAAAAALAFQVPLDDRVEMDDVGVRVSAHLSELRVPRVAGSNTLERGVFDLDITKDGLLLEGEAALAAIPVKLQGSMDFNAGPPEQMVQKVVVTGRPTAVALRGAGVDVTDIADGAIPATVTVQDRRNGSESISIEGDLTESVLSVGPLAWTKPAGAAASLTAALSLQHGKLVGVDRFLVRGSQFGVSGSAKALNGRVNSVSLDDLRLGRTHGRGTVQIAPDGPVGIVVSADTLDLSGKLTEKGSDSAGDARPVTTPSWALDARAAQVILANDARAANLAVKARGNGEAVQALDAVTALEGGTRATVRISPAGSRRVLRVEADDAGRLLRGLDVVRVLQSGRLVVDATLDSLDRYHPMAGSAVIDETRLMRTPAVGKLLQAVTIYGLADVVRGPGMQLSKVVVPFTYDGRAIHISNGRAYNSSLGLTAQGSIGTRAGRIAMDGTVVPAYFFNSALGGLPVVGKLFSPEKGGGVFAVGFSLSGDLNDPTVSVNPVSALTPGFLRNLFSKQPQEVGPRADLGAAAR